jgi:hypothetical protein
LFKADLVADSISLGEVAPIVPGVLMRLVLGHEIEGLLRMVLLLRPFSTPLRHVLAAFSKAVLPQSRRKRPANNFVTVEHRGIWSARMIVATVSSVSSLRPSTRSTRLPIYEGCRTSDPDGASEIAAAVRLGFGLASPDPSSSSRYEQNPKSKHENGAMI